MDAFVDTYFEIDRGMTGVIKSKQLVEHFEDKNYSPSFIRKWMRLFDRDNSGVVTIEEYCSVLGMDHKKVLAKRGISLRFNGEGETVSLDPDVIVLSNEMTEQLQVTVVNAVKEELSKVKQLKDAARRIKLNLDNNVGKLWHVMIVDGQFWCYYSHEPGYSMSFRLGREVFIIWRTQFL